MKISSYFVFAAWWCIFSCVTTGISATDIPCDEDGTGCPWDHWCEIAELTCYKKREAGMKCNVDEKCFSDYCQDGVCVDIDDDDSLASQPTWTPTGTLTWAPTWAPTWEPGDWATWEPTSPPLPTETDPFGAPTWKPTWEPTWETTREPDHWPTWEPQPEGPACEEVYIDIDEFCQYINGTVFLCDFYDCVTPFTRKYTIQNNGSKPVVVESFSRNDKQGGFSSLMDLLSQETEYKNIVAPFDQVTVQDRLFAVTNAGCNSEIGVEVTADVAVEEKDGIATRCTVFADGMGFGGEDDDNISVISGSCSMRIQMKCGDKNEKAFACNTPLKKVNCPIRVQMTYTVKNVGNSKMELKTLIRTDDSGRKVNLLKKRGTLVLEPNIQEELSEVITIEQSRCAKGTKVVRIYGTSKAANTEYSECEAASNVLFSIK